ncbi:MAG: ABC transporter permease [Beijerinckiaceae bacterium]|jgi:putative spermidine/putrescine transport system permease protein|nr:ABC transporter permease [Beijerinckiaceae bacterium]
MMVSGRVIPVGRIAYLGAVAMVMLLVLAPLIVVIWTAFFVDKIVAFPPSGYTLDWFGRAIMSATFRDSFLLSLRVGATATILGLLVGVPTAMALVRRNFVGKRMIAFLTVAPLLVPAIVAGSSIYLYYIDIEVRTEIQVAGTFAGLVAAHTLIGLPWIVRLVVSSLSMMNRHIEEASLILGASPFVTFYRITLPLIRPGIVAGGLFAFVVSLADLEVSLFLVGAGSTTLSIAILNYLQWGLDPTIAAVATLQILIIGAALWISDRYVHLSRVF